MLNIFNKKIKKYESKIEKINIIYNKYKEIENQDLIDLYKNTDNELEILAIGKIISDRVLGLLPHDVQLIGALVLSEGKIAQMKTGEGKTLVAALASLIKVKHGKVHIVTVNEYLSLRDYNEMRILFNTLNISVGNINKKDIDIKEEYNKDIVYGVHNNFILNYLKNNMMYKIEDLINIRFDYCIVDEIDSILIDEARTPIHISGPKDTNKEIYKESQKMVKKLTKTDYDKKKNTIYLNSRGIEKLEKLLKKDNLFKKDEVEKIYHINLALKANYLLEENKDYIVKENEIIAINKLTGRLTGGRFGDGLHQALEEKHNLEIKDETQIYNKITYQNYFRLYDNLSGMTGTAITEEEEFRVIYKLDVVDIKTNKEVKRIDNLDIVYLTKEIKFKEIVKKIKEINKKGQPILIGTGSVESSDIISELLKRENINHEVLNAKNHEREAEIISKAGQKGKITVSTNMAGRGVDIKIDEDVEKLGGLYVLGIERYENRRIDNQLIGRSGRQGDKGESQFYLSLEDDLIIKNDGLKIKNMMEKFGGLSKNDNLNNKRITKSIESIQKRIEGNHFNERKHILEYDDIINEHRKIFFQFRDDLLKDKVLIKDKSDEYCDYYKNYISMSNNKKEELILLGIDNEDKIKEVYKSKVNQIKEKVNNDRDVEKELALLYLDQLWMKHLMSMNMLIDTTRLRVYNNQDPLSEYKKESFIIFENFILNFKKELIKNLILFKIEEISDKKTEKTDSSLNKIQKNSKSTEVPKIGCFEDNLLKKKKEREEKKLKKLKN